MYSNNQRIQSALTENTVACFDSKNEYGPSFDVSIAKFRDFPMVAETPVMVISKTKVHVFSNARIVEVEEMNGEVDEVSWISLEICVRLVIAIQILIMFYFLLV